ncbi:MAG: hypothetical protein OTJ98_09415, partial [Dehalococcoidia bacterium]|nr:hypothetical protein [Dehalococcoidia bacterium]
MPLIAAIHTNNLSLYISGFVGRKAMLGWAGALMIVVAVACTSVGENTSVDKESPGQAITASNGESVDAVIGDIPSESQQSELAQAFTADEIVAAFESVIS